jgi:hypothetical protein
VYYKSCVCACIHTHMLYVRIQLLLLKVKNGKDKVVHVLNSLINHHTMKMFEELEV